MDSEWLREGLRGMYTFSLEVMESQVAKKMENEMEAGVYLTGGLPVFMALGSLYSCGIGYRR